MSVQILRGVDSLGRCYTSRAKVRPCAQCGQQIRRRGTNVKFCSRDCYAVSIAGKPIAPDVLAARVSIAGDLNPNWLGDSVSARGGRTRALRFYRCIGPCIRCGADKAERHHKDGNTANNEPKNIEALCRRCHMKEDGRLDSVRARPGRGSKCR